MAFKKTRARKWTIDVCRQTWRRYKSIKQFSAAHKGAYTMVCRNGWLPLLRADFPDALKPHGFWDCLKTCREEWKKYPSQSSFQKGSPGAYAVASKRGWLKTMRNDFPNAKKRNYWTLNHCRKTWRSYSDIKSFSINHAGAYAAVLRNGWLEILRKDFPDAIKSNHYWSLNRCRSLWIRFTSIKELREKHPSVYSQVSKKKWVRFMREHFPDAKKRDYWTIKNCRVAWLSCESISEFSLKYSGAYDAVHKNGWLGELYKDLPISRRATANDTIYLLKSSIETEGKIIAKVGITSARRGLSRIKSLANKHKTSFEVLRLIHNLENAKIIEQFILKNVTPIRDMKGDGHKEFFAVNKSKLTQILSLLDRLSSRSLKMS